MTILLWVAAGVTGIGLIALLAVQDKLNRITLERINLLQKRLLELERTVFDPDATCPECGQRELCDCCEIDCRDIPAQPTKARRANEYRN